MSGVQKWHKAPNLTISTFYLCVCLCLSSATHVVAISLNYWLALAMALVNPFWNHAIANHR